MSDEIAAAKRSGEDAEARIAEMRELGAEIKRLEAELAEIERRRDELGATLPNLPDPEAPDGAGGGRRHAPRGRASGPPSTSRSGTTSTSASSTGWIDIAKAAAASGARFAYLLGDPVLVELALIRFAVEGCAAEGFKPVVPPVLVREGPLYGTGFFPGEPEMIYEIERDELFLVGTSEVSLAALHADEILDAERLPLRYAGISTCFRREAGAAGKDTRGIFRVHQFDKVEMFSYVHPDEGRAEHERLLAIEEGILQALEIPYRVVDIALGELGAPGGAEVRLRGLDPEPGALPRVDVVLEHDGLPGAAPRAPASGLRPMPPRRCSTA